jgi:effector-binding domain-containing protein
MTREPQTSSTAQPRLADRAGQHYAAVPARVTMSSIASAIDQAFPEVSGYLTERAIVPAGPPFIRYLVIDMERELRIEMGVPTGVPVPGSGRVRPGVLPAGRYAVLRHTGPYDRLAASNAALQEWAREQGVALDCWQTPEGLAWHARVEHYLTDPSAEPDPAKWEVDVAYLTSGQEGA